MRTPQKTMHKVRQPLIACLTLAFVSTFSSSCSLQRFWEKNITPPAPGGAPQSTGQSTSNSAPSQSRTDLKGMGVEPGKAEAPKAPEALKPVETSKVSEPGKVTEAGKPVEAGKSVEVAKTSEVAKPAEPVKVAEPVKPQAPAQAPGFFSRILSKITGKTPEKGNETIVSKDFAKGLNMGSVQEKGAWNSPDQAVENGGAPKANEPVHHCFTVTYRHKAIAGHKNEESCSQHKNLLKIKGTQINPSSVCVRVNGRPVKYQASKDHPDELIIGAIAGPKAKITVRYCVAKNTCNEDCTIPKDEFMDAIGGLDQDDVQNAQAGQWDPAESTAHMDGEIKKEMAEFNDSGVGENMLFRDWISDSDTGVPACESTKQASSPLSEQQS